MPQSSLDLSRVFDLEPHGPDTYVGESPAYEWGAVFGGLAIAQALWAATQTVKPEHGVHSIHAYFILRGDIAEPLRFEVDRVRNGRSFTTRRVIARQSAGAILSLACSFQVAEGGPQTQSTRFPEGAELPPPGATGWDAGSVRIEVPRDESAPPGSRVWSRFPGPLGDDMRLHAAALAYLSDVNPMSAVMASHPEPISHAEEWDNNVMATSLDHAVWFHRPVRADDWVLFDLVGHGVIGSRGLATGPVFSRDGTHVATIAQEGLLRDRRKTHAR